MYIPYFTITPKITSLLEEVANAFGYFRGISLPTDFEKEYVAKVISETVHASTAIEGNRLTNQQVSTVLKGGKVSALDRDIKEVENYNKAVSFIKSLRHDTFQINEKLIKEMHTIIMEGVKDKKVGGYRSGQVYVGDYIPPEGFKVPSLMGEFVEWLRNPKPELLSPILYSGIAHYRFVEIHPFEDGNGRTSRILTKLMLMKGGYDITSYFSLEAYYNRDRNAYYKALSTADQNRKDGRADLTIWLEYFVNGLVIEANRAVSRLEEELTAYRRQESPLRLTENQTALLKMLEEKKTIKLADYMEVTGLSKSGGYKDFEALIKYGLIERKGKYKGAYYILTEKGYNYLQK